MLTCMTCTDMHWKRIDLVLHGKDLITCTCMVGNLILNMFTLSFSILLYHIKTVANQTLFLDNRSDVCVCVLHASYTNSWIKCREKPRCKEHLTNSGLTFWTSGYSDVCTNTWAFSYMYDRNECTLSVRRVQTTWLLMFYFYVSSLSLYCFQVYKFIL